MRERRAGQAVEDPNLRRGIKVRGAPKVGSLPHLPAQRRPFTCVDLNFWGCFLAGFGCVFCLFGVLVLCCLVFCCFLLPSRVRSFELCAKSMQS